MLDEHEGKLYCVLHIGKKNYDEGGSGVVCIGWSQQQN
jgi:hypothetical protein